MKTSSIEILKRLVVATLVLACSASVVAGKGKGGKAAGSLTLMPFDTVSASFLVDGEPASDFPENYPNFGSQVGFLVDVTGVDENDTYTIVACNSGDEGVRVYYDKQTKGHIYLMDDIDTDPFSWDGSSAECRAILMHCASKGNRTGACELLDDEPFTVSGT